MPVTMDLSNEAGMAMPLTEDELIAVCELVLAEEGVSRPCFVSLTVLPDSEMAAQNLEWRGIDAPTDVISLECERPDDPDLAEDEPCELGDILLAPEYLGRQAERYGTTHADETRLMLIHGMLHLLGYDHLEEEEALEMEAREDELLALVATDAPAPVTLTRHRGAEQP